MDFEVLSPAELRRAVSILTQTLQHNQITFGIIGGAGCSLISLHYGKGYRGTMDIDLVIQADINRGVDADTISKTLYTNYPQQFAKKDIGYGVFVPAVRIIGDNGQNKLVEVEMFDFKSWKNRPQYDLSMPDNDRVTLPVNDTAVAVLSPRWLLREKILSQYQRQGNRKEITDIEDITTLLGLVPAKCLSFSSAELIAALRNLLGKLPELREALKTTIECPEVFNS